jgi:Tol biopolymer transport system component
MIAAKQAPREIRTWSDSLGYDLTVSILGLIVVGGSYLDGWAHNHDRVDQSFATPWHAVLYGGVVAFGALLGVTALSNHSRGASWRDALPPAYRLSILGVLLFVLAGFGDLGWHAAFGIEEDTAALLSPTHLSLALAGVLAVCGPWRAALAKFPEGQPLSWALAAPLVVSVASFTGIAAFMTHFAHPVVDPISARERPALSVRPDIYIMNADGSAQTRITADADIENSFSAWSPDGGLLISGGEPEGQTDLYVLGRDGMARQLTRTPGNDRHPSWSPEGTSVAFISTVELTTSSRNRERQELFLINADGSGQRLLTNSGTRKYGTTWSPDSRQIAFSARVQRTWQVFVINVDGSGLRQLTSSSDNSLAPAWSSDGRTIAFQRSLGGGRSQIHLMDPIGGNVRALHGTGRDFSPAWSPDGDRLAFTAFKDGRGDIYTMNREGTDLRNLTQSAGLSYDNAAWSPDGGRLSFTAWAPVSAQDHEVMRRLGVSSVIIQTALLIAPMLLIMRRWQLPFGWVTLIVLVTSLGASVIRDHYELLPAALVAGLAGDAFLYQFGKRALSTAAMRVFAVAVPAVFYTLYFVTLMIDVGVDWNVHLWAGSIAIAAATGLGLTYLVAPPKAKEGEAP